MSARSGRARRRSAKDPRVVEVMAALERVIDSPERDDSCLDAAASTILGTVIDRFTVPALWSDAAVRAVALAIALHAPDEDLDEMVEGARKEVAWIGRFERDQAITATGATAARATCSAEAN